MVGILQNPNPQRPAGSVEFLGRLQDADENRLHCIFGFSWITQDLHGHANHQPLITVEYHRESVVVAVGKKGHHDFVR